MWLIVVLSLILKKDFFLLYLLLICYDHVMLAEGFYDTWANKFWEFMKNKRCWEVLVYGLSTLVCIWIKFVGKIESTCNKAFKFKLWNYLVYLIFCCWFFISSFIQNQWENIKIEVFPEVKWQSVCDEIP